jgi:succinoglycan biosynthesis transport protein ExoP
MKYLTERSHLDAHSPPGNPLSIWAQVRRFGRELRRWWWLPLAGSAALFLAFRYLAVDPAPPVFTGVARMWVGGKIKLPEGSLYQEELQNFYGTQIELMQSRTIQRRAQARVRRARPDLPEEAVKLTVAASPKAAVFTLTATGGTTAYVQAFLNAVMDEYLEYKREVRAQSADSTLVSITSQLGRLEAEFRSAQDKLGAFLRTNSLAALQEQGTGAAAYLAELSRKCADLKLQRHFFALLGAESEAQGLPASSGAPRSGSLELDVRRELSVLKTQRDDWAKTFRPKHPRMVQLEERIRQQEELLAFARSQSRDELRQRLTALDLEMKNIESVMREWEDRVLVASARMAEHDRLKQTVDRHQRLYDQLVATIRTVDVNRNLDQEMVAVLERAEPMVAALHWVPPREFLGALAGAIGGLGVIVLLMFINNKVTSIEDLETKLDESVLGQIPEVVRRDEPGRPLLLQCGDQRHGFAESFKSIRSSLYYSTVDGNRPKTLLVTSAIPGEGKSTVAVNLARAFAFAGYGVLLVEGDLRCGVLHQLLQVAAEPGLSDVLRDGLEPSRVIVPTEVPNLSFLPQGRPINDPGELFLSDAADRFLGAIAKDYDYVILDSAPVLAADDTTSLAPKVEGIVFVVRGGFTSIPLARRGLELLHQRQGRVLGVVCNRGAADLNHSGYEKVYQRHRGSNGLEHPALHRPA